jgi:hypothetical protein
MVFLRKAMFEASPLPCTRTALTGSEPQIAASHPYKEKPTPLSQVQIAEALIHSSMFGVLAPVPPNKTLFLEKRI